MRGSIKYYGLKFRTWVMHILKQNQENHERRSFNRTHFHKEEFERWVRDFADMSFIENINENAFSMSLDINKYYLFMSAISDKSLATRLSEDNDDRKEIIYFYEKYKKFGQGNLKVYLKEQKELKLIFSTIFNGKWIKEIFEGTEKFKNNEKKYMEALKKLQNIILGA